MRGCASWYAFVTCRTRSAGCFHYNRVLVAGAAMLDQAQRDDESTAAVCNAANAVALCKVQRVWFAKFIAVAME